jgi:hypothetical protein
MNDGPPATRHKRQNEEKCGKTVKQAEKRQKTTESAREKKRRGGGG